MSTTNNVDGQTPNPLRKDPRKLTTLSEILSCLSLFQSEDAQLSNRLSELISAQEPIAASLERLTSLVPQLDELHVDATLLSERVSATAKTADRVGGRVRSLDEEMSRVREANEWVGQVMELKTSLISLQASIDAQDWESAARHCARAMALPLEVTSGSFAEVAVPTSENPLPPAQTLQNAREQLLAIFQRNFEAASSSRDAAATSRFFKLFPTIGWEAEGLLAYANFVVDLIHVRPPASAKTSSPLYYITALTSIFESIAMIVDQHQPVVEKYYGAGKMNSVIKRLLDECDKTVIKLVEGWEEERTMKRKLADASNTVFSPTQSSMKRQGPPVDEADVDPREIDKVLQESAGMASRWSLFRRFLYDRMRDDAPEDSLDEDSQIKPLQASKSNGENGPSTNGLDIELLQNTASHRRMEAILSTYYTPLELWYVRTIIEKAHRLSTPDTDQTPLVTSTPDDVFYILKLVLHRLLSTGSLATLERTLNRLSEVLIRDYTGAIKKKLDDVYANSGNVTPVQRDRVEKENRTSFIILLNDLDVSSSHLDRLIKDVTSVAPVAQNYLDSEQTSVREALSTVSTTVGPKLRTALRTGIEQLFNQLLRPKLRTLIADIYQGVTYMLDEESYAQSEYADLVRKRFVKAWESLVDGYKDTFTEDNYRLFFGLALDVLIRPWEKHIVSLKYTELGAIRFDRDLRAIMNYLSSQTAFGDAREKFVRLQQVSTILNLDAEEDVDEFYNGSGITWKLTAQDARGVAALKV